MTREEAIARIKEHKITHKMNEPRAIYISEALDMAIKALEANDWIPIKMRPLTAEEKEESPEWEYIYECKLPDDCQDVLITTRFGGVTMDVFYNGADGSYFEEYCDDGDVIAWMPLPEPYKGD